MSNAIRPILAERAHSDLAKDFCKKLDSLVAREGRSRSALLRDFIEASFRAIRGQTLSGKALDENEAAYLQIVKRCRDQKTMSVFSELLGVVVMALKERPLDFLGPIYTEIAASAGLGQFFTPNAVCEMMARIQIGDARDLLARTGRTFLLLHEPTCGCGAMILASDLAIAEQGLDIGREIHWVAVDVDFHAQAVAYVQASLTGASGTFIHGDTLRLTQWTTSLTPAAIAYPKTMPKKQYGRSLAEKEMARA